MHSHTGLGPWKSKLTALELVKEGATTLRPPPTKLGLKKCVVQGYVSSHSWNVLMTWKKEFYQQLSVEGGNWTLWISMNYLKCPIIAMGMWSGIGTCRAMIKINQSNFFISNLMYPF